MLNQRATAFASISLVLFTPFFVSAAECPGQHCSKKSAQVNAMCKAAGKNGEPVFVEHNGGYCYCVCSCLAANTLVETPGDFKQISSLSKGDTVLALSADGKWSPQPVVFSEGTSDPDEPYPYAIYVSVKEGPAIVATADHLFLTTVGLKRADRLSPRDRLLDKDRKPLEIDSLTNGAYNGGIHNIVAKEFPDESQPVEPHDHLINTAGVISGDYYLQLYHQTSEVGLSDTPQVGSLEYQAAYPEESKALKETVRAKVDLGDGVFFVPASKFAPPAGACSFLPPGKDRAKAAKLAPLDASVPLAMARYLVSHYRTYYPEVKYHIEWNDNTVNAYAWQENGEKHVAILGGLLRHEAIKLEGAGLVLAHELGHHYGGKPRFPNHPWPASCEGQADYWGALVAQRVVWFGEEAMRQTDAGANQLYDLFANGLIENLLEGGENNVGAAGICSHPPAQCRLDTYRAAMRLDDKPACAGDPPVLASEAAFMGDYLKRRKMVSANMNPIIWATPATDAQVVDGPQPELALPPTEGSLAGASEEDTFTSVLVVD